MAAGPGSRHRNCPGEAMSVVAVSDLALRFGDRTLFEELSFELERGELLAVLGPNGTGKTSLIRILLGLLEPSAGSVVIEGCPPRERCHRIGYVPQQRVFDRDIVLRGRDLVRLGLDGHRWGFGRFSPEDHARVDASLAEVGAAAYADAPIGRLSGGEQQRLRIAQALVSEPQILLCDEPLASLDLRHQQGITELLRDWRQRSGGTILFVTHDVNPVLQLVDRVLFVVNGRWAAGTPDEVLTTEQLSALYGSHVDVVRVHDRILVVGELTESGFNLDEPHHPPDLVSHERAHD